MDEAESYLFGLFEKVRCLRETARGEVWLGADRAGRPVIYKRIRRTGLPLAELKALSHPLWPEIYAFSKTRRRARRTSSKNACRASR